MDQIKHLGVRAIAIESDVTDVPKHDGLVKQIVAELGHLDILINNAGVLGALPLGQITEQDFDRVFNTNAKVSRCMTF